MEAVTEVNISRMAKVRQRIEASPGRLEERCGCRLAIDALSLAEKGAGVNAKVHSILLPPSIP